MHRGSDGDLDELQQRVAAKQAICKLNNAFMVGDARGFAQPIRNRQGQRLPGSELLFVEGRKIMRYSLTSSPGVSNAAKWGPLTADFPVKIVVRPGRGGFSRVDQFLRRPKVCAPQFLTAVIGLIVLCVLSAGCAVLCPEPSPQAKTKCGQVRLDFPSCRRLRVLHQDVLRDPGGHLVVRTEWCNTSDEPYEAQVKIEFFDKEERRERSKDVWIRHKFQPGGGQIIECTSETTGAVSYLIQVRSSSVWPF